MSFTPKSNFAPGDSVSVAIESSRIFGIVLNVKFDKCGHTYDVWTNSATLRDVDKSSLSAFFVQAPPNYGASYWFPNNKNVKVPIKASADALKPDLTIGDFGLGRLSARSRCAKANSL